MLDIADVHVSEAASMIMGANRGQSGGAVRQQTRW